MDQTFLRLFRSLGLALLTLLILLTLAFFLLKMAPGSPLSARHITSAQVHENLEHHYGLDRPLFEQYLGFLERLVLRFDLGPSFSYADRPVTDILLTAMPPSAAVAGIALACILAGGFALGAAGALTRGSPVDVAVVAFTAVAQVVPSFVVAPLLVLVFTFWFRLFPGGGWNGGSPANLVLPVATVVLAHTPNVARLVRLSMLEILGSPFVLAARARGMPPVRLFFHHVLRPSLLPVIAYLGTLPVPLFGSVVLVDMYFSTGGVGTVFIDALSARDYAVAMGVTLVGGVTVLAANTLSEFALTLLDPRVRR